MEQMILIFQKVSMVAEGAMDLPVSPLQREEIKALQEMEDKHAEK